MVDYAAALTEAKTGFLEARRHLGFFDASCWLGQQAAPEFTTADTREALLAQMDRFDIKRALVTHTASRDYDPVLGNDMLVAAIRGQDRLVGTVVMVPGGTNEHGDVGAALDRYISGGARAVRLFPVLHRFSLADWCAGSLLSAMQERRMPLILWHSETSWDALFALTGTYPDLPVIIEGTEGTGRKIMYFNRFYYPLLEQRPNVTIELHYMYNFLVLQDIVARFGANRLVFGSYLPLNDPDATMMRVTHAGINDEAKQLIASGNLERLVQQVAA